MIKEKEVAMLWHWRAIEGDNPIFREESIEDIVRRIFGLQYEILLSQINIHNYSGKDFILNNKLYSDLSDEEKECTKIISMWRYHAFEWIVGNSLWNCRYSPTCIKTFKGNAPS